MKLDFLKPVIDNAYFTNALEDVCMFCGRGCLHKFEVHEDCPLYFEILRLKEKCDNVLEIVNELSAQAKRLEPEEVYDYPERDDIYYYASRGLHYR